MPTQAFTANMETLRKLADDALASPTGLTINFRVEQHGDLAICLSRARSMQTTFNSLRARVRKLTVAEKGAAVHFKRGYYDQLACVRQPLPHEQGWCVKLIHAKDLFTDVEITAGDGSPMVDENEMKALATKMVSDFPHFTIYDYDRLEELSPGFFQDDAQGWVLRREHCDGRDTAFGPESYPAKVKPAIVAIDPNARHVDLAEVLTPGNLWEDDGDTET